LSTEGFGTKLEARKWSGSEAWERRGSEAGECRGAKGGKRWRAKAKKWSGSESVDGRSQGQRSGKKKRKPDRPKTKSFRMIESKGNEAAPALLEKRPGRTGW